MKRNAIIIVALACAAAAFVTVSFAEVKSRPAPDQPVPKMLERPKQGILKEPNLKPGATVTAFELAWKQRGKKEVSNRLYGAIGVLVGEDRAASIAENGLLENVVQGKETGSWSRLGHSPIMARYQPEYDEIRIFNEELSAIGHSEDDVGEDGARDLAEEYLASLGKAGVIDPRLYARAAMQLGFKMVGEGSVDEEPQPGRIVEYRITYRPRLNGFEMANAGVRMGILPSGELASLRLGGVTPAGKWRGDRLASSAGNAKREIRVGTDELMRRFYKQVPEGAEAQIAWSRVMYAMPEGKSEAVVEPMLLISYSESREVGNQRVTSRRKMLGYSLTNPKAAPINFDPPAARHEEPRVTRKADQAGKGERP